MSSIKIKADTLKSMVSRSIKGVSNNKLIPLTSLMAIIVKDNRLTLITTDATNYLYIIEDKVMADDFYAVVDANIFSKLVLKMTCEYVIIRINLSVLEISGNGNYKIELPLDENGEPIKYPDPVSEIDWNNAETLTFNKSTADVILETIKPALAVTNDNPCYVNYYIGNQVVATDTFKIASMDVKLFNTPKLVSPELFDLLSVMTDEKINVEMTDSEVVYKTPDCIVYGKFMPDIEEYSIDAIMSLVNTEFDSFCAIPKNALIQLLSRLILFVGTYDKNAIDLTFTKEGLQVSSKMANGVELIKYVSSENFKDFTCTIDVQMLMSEVRSIQTDVIEMYYGEDNAIKLTDGNITIVIALMDDSE